MVKTCDGTLQPSADCIQRRRPLLAWDAATRPDLALPRTVLPTKVCAHTYGQRLAALVAEALALPPEVEPALALSKLHEQPEGLRFQQQVGTNARLSGRHAKESAGLPKAGRHDAFGKRFSTHRHRDADFRARMDATVREFVRDAVLPALDGAAHGWEELVYQAVPSLRVHMPRTRPSIGLHRDFDYYHQPTEINVWVPLVPHVGGTNSLYCESSPGRGDYRPFEARLGELVRFYGNQHSHFAVVNETDVTRVSLDLRVIPAPHFQAAWASPHGDVHFQLGGYYACTTTPDALGAQEEAATIRSVDESGLPQNLAEPDVFCVS